MPSNPSGKGRCRPVPAETAARVWQQLLCEVRHPTVVTGRVLLHSNRPISTAQNLKVAETNDPATPHSDVARNVIRISSAAQI